MRDYSRKRINNIIYGVLYIARPGSEITLEQEFQQQLKSRTAPKSSAKGLTKRLTKWSAGCTRQQQCKKKGPSTSQRAAEA
jgi:hypothetical protein